MRSHKFPRYNRLVFFFFLGLALFTLSGLTPALRAKITGLGGLFIRRAAPRSYLAEQLEMECTRLKAELELAGLPKPNLESQLAHVIARDPLTPHILWIDVGVKNCPFIAKFSPICIGPHAIGLVEEAGRYRSKVRLLSDPKLHPHICSGKKPAIAKHYVDQLTALLPDPVSLSALELIEKKIGTEKPKEMASGQLKGFKRGQSRFLGEAIRGEFMPGDLLVTSGYDGVFPAGLFVARITTIYQKPGEIQSIEAEPTYPYHSLRAVFVLPAEPGA